MMPYQSSAGLATRLKPGKLPGSGVVITLMRIVLIGATCTLARVYIPRGGTCGPGPTCKEDRTWTLMTSLVDGCAGEKMAAPSPGHSPPNANTCSAATAHTSATKVRAEIFVALLRRHPSDIAMSPAERGGITREPQAFGIPTIRVGGK